MRRNNRKPAIVTSCLIRPAMLIFVACLVMESLISCDSSEDEKFNPIVLEVKSDELTRTAENAYSVPAEGGSFTVYNTDKRHYLPYTLNYIEENGEPNYANDECFFSENGSYPREWGVITMSPTETPTKYQVTVYPNTSGKQRTIKIGFNCFSYSYRILEFNQPEDIEDK